MDVKRSGITYPKSVLSLYLKLFCKRRNSDKNKMLEGIQSWLTLSKSEKQQFFNKYKECRLNHKVKVANYLTKVQPYLKKRDIKRTHTHLDTSKQSRKEEPNLENDEEIVHELEDENCFMDTDHLANDEHATLALDHSSTFYREVQKQLVLSSDQVCTCNNEEQQRPVLAEPAPPSVRTGKELFEMLKGTSENINNESWSTLSNLQKSRYQQATLLLKNNYIQKYKAYLESLPSKELFNCYNNFFD